MGQTERGEIQEKILDGIVQCFGEKGVKFTMDDVATLLHMSKKTIYVYFHDKEEMLIQMVDYVFDMIHSLEVAVAVDPSLTIYEKVEKVMTVLPDRYHELNMEQLELLSEKYPSVYKRITIRINSNWDTLIELLKQGVKEGVFREFSIPIFQLMITSTVDGLFSTDFLKTNKMRYVDGLCEAVKIILEGIMNKGK